MKYHVGDKVVCLVETRPSGGRYILAKDPDPKLPFEELTVQIISAIQPFPEMGYVYRILIPQDCVGWVISRYHVESEKIPAGFLHQKFWDLTEDYIIRNAKG